MLKRIHFQRNRTWHFQDLVGQDRTPYYYWAESKCGNKNCRYNILLKWRHRHAKAKTLWQHIGTAVSITSGFANVNYYSPQFAGLLCIHSGYKDNVKVGSGEGAWNANTGNGYYGGLQMDYTFETTYGATFYAKWGNANNWPPLDQLIAGYRAVLVRGYSPWPTTRIPCGL